MVISPAPTTQAWPLPSVKCLCLNDEICVFIILVRVTANIGSRFQRHPADFLDGVRFQGLFPAESKITMEHALSAASSIDVLHKKVVFHIALAMFSGTSWDGAGFA